MSQVYTYKYPHPAVTVDALVFGFDGTDLRLLLIERGKEPYAGKWAFPGGFMEMDETAEEGVLRELQEETGLQVVNMRQIGAFSAVHRDPRERVVSIAFYTLVRLEDDSVLQAGDVLYLERKRKKAAKKYQDVPHVVVAGESMYTIAQRYGVRLESLYEMNNLPDDYAVQVGDRLRLR